MSDWKYSEDELDRYFSDPERRHRPDDQPSGAAAGGFFGFIHRRIHNPKLAQATVAVFVLVSLVLIGTLSVILYMVTLRDELPKMTKIENPDFQLATIAYTADGKELARYARKNRSWVVYEQISPHVINALVATEDHRFYQHWGIDLVGLMGAFADVIRKGDMRGGSTLTMQLARNLYNDEIGRRVTVERKLKEMVTAVYLEQRYTKREIIEMYLNTVEFPYNAFGIEAASRTFFGKDPMDLSELESAMLVGMQQATTLYNPIKNPEYARRRRNVVLSLMVKHGHLGADFLDAHKDEPVNAKYHSSAVTASLAPYFAEHVHKWLEQWGGQNGYDVTAEGLVVHTTLDSRYQELAQAAVEEQMTGLQAVVDYEWSRPSGYHIAYTTEPYLKKEGYEPFSYFWKSNKDLQNKFIQESTHFANLRRAGVGTAEALSQLQQDSTFMDSLRTTKTRLEAGFVAIDPLTGHVKAWVGGRDLAVDWNDHVAGTRRQPGSTFKPFVYTAAIHNGWSPYHTYRDTLFTHVDAVGNVWSPKNSEGVTGELMTLREGLARSKNTITGQLVLDVGAPEVAFFARRMGIRHSELDEVPSLALGTSDVSLLEMATAYGTLANGGLYYEPAVVTRIEDRYGNVLFEQEPAPEEALSQRTAYTIVDMMRDVIQYGTGIRVRNMFGLGEYDLAGKTGTTQNSADGWFMLMHPNLVMGSWVGFNDRRMTFRTNWWGQGAHNALFVVGDFAKRATSAGLGLTKGDRFPDPAEYGADYAVPLPNQEQTNRRNNRGRVGW